MLAFKVFSQSYFIFVVGFENYTLITHDIKNTPKLSNQHDSSPYKVNRIYYLDKASYHGTDIYYFHYYVT